MRSQGSAKRSGVIPAYAGVDHARENLRPLCKRDPRVRGGRPRLTEPKRRAIR